MKPIHHFEMTSICSKVGNVENDNMEVDIDEKSINEQHKIWKKNAPFLYDIVVTHSLQWPSLTVQWLPDKTCSADQDYSKQRLLLGTNTSGTEQNYLMIAELQLPQNDDDVVEEKGEEVGGGYGRLSGEFQIIQRIIHDGEVNRCRYMPQNANIIATKTNSCEVFVFDKSHHPSKPDQNGKCDPDLRLLGHTKEGYGLSWNPHIRGHLVSGSDDKVICLWDLASASKIKQSLQPKDTYLGHTDIVEDVDWNYHNEHVFASCGDDKMICVWDVRERTPTSKIVEAHSAEINSLSFNPYTEHLLLSASSDKTAGLWDLRKLQTKLHSFESHEGQLYNIEWSPFSATVMASSGLDRQVRIWDLSKIGLDQDPEDARDGPPELLFIHGGHSGRITDFSWNRNDDWMLSSVSDDNTVHIWQMAENIFSPDDESNK